MVTELKYCSRLRNFNKFTMSIFRDFEVSIPSLCDTNYYTSRTLSGFRDSCENLKRAFQNILDQNENWDYDTLSEAYNLLAKMIRIVFHLFFINCFYTIL